MSKIVSNMQRAYRGKRYQWQFSLGGLVLAAAVWGALTYITEFPAYLNWIIASSTAAFIFFGWDKAKARTDSDVRIPETSLHLLNLAGGFIGGFAGIYIWRHKTNFRKYAMFPLVIGISAVIHGAIFWFFFLGT